MTTSTAVGRALAVWAAALGMAGLVRAQSPEAAPAPVATPAATPAATPTLSLDLREAIVRVPATVQDAFGKTISGDLVVTVFRPPGAGPHPLAVISHGRDSATRAQMQRQRFESQARFLVRKGFAVAVPLRLGYGELAEAGDPEDSMSCATPRYGPAVEAAAQQVLAVVRHLQREPDIDPARTVLVGQSVGGITTVAATALPVPGLVASVNFAGGHGGRHETHPGDPCSPLSVERLMAGWATQTAATTRVPMLWVYSENDRYFAPQVSRRWHAAYVAAGGRAELQMLPPFGTDGHSLFTRGVDLWAPVVDAFLAAHGFAAPGAIARPPASGFARIDDAAALPFLNARSREQDYPRFLTLPLPRAFAIGAPNRWGSATGDDALSRALANCQRRSTQPCRLWAVDHDVVWTP